MCKHFLSILIFFVLCSFATGQTVLAENSISSGYGDIGEGGQSFTVVKSVQITEIQLKVQAINGGSDFTIFLSGYDPWNHVHGPTLGEKTISKESLTAFPGDSWISVIFDSPITLTSGIYAFNFDTHNEETPGAYNNYAMESSNVFRGGRRILAPSGSNWYTNHHDLAFRIIGFGDPDSFSPPIPSDPHLKIHGLSTRTWTTSRFVDYEHMTQSGVVYARESSTDLISWDGYVSYRLGDGFNVSASASALNYHRFFIRIRPILLADTVGQKE